MRHRCCVWVVVVGISSHLLFRPCRDDDARCIVKLYFIFSAGRAIACAGHGGDCRSAVVPNADIIAYASTTSDDADFPTDCDSQYGNDPFCCSCTEEDQSKVWLLHLKRGLLNLPPKMLPRHHRREVAERSPPVVPLWLRRWVVVAEWSQT